MKKAYATMLCNGDGYVPGAEVLGKSLAASGSKVPRVAMVTADISLTARAKLEHQGWEVRLVGAISNPTPDSLLMFARFGPVFTKLRAWELTDFDRVVLLDADTLVLKNVDDLFERPGFAAAPDFFLPDRFNSGVMVIPPSLETFGKMVEALSVAPSYDGGDQGFLNSFYADWYAMPAVNRLRRRPRICPARRWSRGTARSGDPGRRAVSRAGPGRRIRPARRSGRSSRGESKVSCLLTDPS